MNRKFNIKDFLNLENKKVVDSINKLSLTEDELNWICWHASLYLKGSKSIFSQDKKRLHQSVEKIFIELLEKIPVERKEKEREQKRALERELANSKTFKIELQIPKIKYLSPFDNNLKLREKNILSYDFSIVIGRDEIYELFDSIYEILPVKKDDFNFDKIKAIAYHNGLKKSKKYLGSLYDIKNKVVDYFDGLENEWLSCKEREKQNRRINRKKHIAMLKTKKAEAILEKQKTILLDSIFNINELSKSINEEIKEISDLNTLLKAINYIFVNSELPFYFNKEFSFQINKNNNIFVVDYLLPGKEDLPTLKKVNYIPSEDSFEEKHISQKMALENYDSILYQFILKFINEIFYFDRTRLIESICFNGWVDTIVKSTGKISRICICSVHVSREEFSEINLLNVDPKACFKGLKGLANPHLNGMVPVKPLIDLEKNDKRFISHYDVANSLDESFNLAAMDWLDFEHLVREIFEREFSSCGGEVKITQSSRDGGVDAIAFDPDPLRGGKIIIQAKRYSNIVGISAVRDLYGTVINEGATRGILVTTSDYGPETYKFAKGKPLSLLNGDNLLYLLEKQGVRAKIDLQEARKIYRDKS